VFRLLNTARGWDTRHTPLHNAFWALEQIAARVGEHFPVCLVGHSLGGRAALLSAGRPQVHSAVDLAPWVYPTDVPDGLSDQQLLIAHGTRDRVASHARSAALARAIGDQAAYISIAGGKHAMLRHHRRFDGLAADFATATLLGDDPGGPISQVRAGEHWIDVG
jgi:dienelactone hydrolase